MSQPPRARRFQRRAKSPEDQVQLRQRLVDVGKQLVANEPERDISLRQVADLAGYAPSALYKYFPTKADLVYAIKEEFLQRSTEYAQSQIEQITEPELRLCVGFESLIDFWSRKPGEFRCVYSYRDRQDTEGEDEKAMSASPITRAARAFSNGLVSEFFHARGIQPTPDLLKLFVDAMVVASHGVVSIPIGSPSFAYCAPEAMARTVVRGLVRSWADFAEFLKVNKLSTEPTPDVLIAYHARI